MFTVSKRETNSLTTFVPDEDEEEELSSLSFLEEFNDGLYALEMPRGNVSRENEEAVMDDGAKDTALSTRSEDRMRHWTA